MKKRWTDKYYKHGVQDWQEGKRLSQNPYPQGTRENQQWTNGWSDRSDQAFLLLVKKNPSILIDK